MILHDIDIWSSIVISATKEAEPEEKKVRQDPKTCKIDTGKEITIEFQKEKNQGIGFYIAGGSNTPCVSITDKSILRGMKVKKY